MFKALQHEYWVSIFVVDTNYCCRY